MNTTKPTKAKEITHDWHIVDVKDQTLGRIATQIATLLMGKHKSYFVRNLDCGDHVVVINARDITVTGKKMTDKIYSSYSGYPGGLHRESFRDLKVRKPEKIVRHAVTGMLPKNKLQARLLKRLYIYQADKHPYTKQMEKKSEKES